MLEREDIDRLMTDYRGGGGGGSNGKSASPVVPVPEPGKTRLAATERFESESGDD